MWSDMPSSTQPIRTLAPVSSIELQKMAVQLGLAKIASATSRPTLRLSTSHAATTWIWLG